MAEKIRTEIKRINVNSSNIKSVEYLEELQILEIEFNSGGIYRYRGVNAVMFNNLINSSSIGNYFAQNIKYKFDTEKIQ